MAKWRPHSQSLSAPKYHSETRSKTRAKAKNVPKSSTEMSTEKPVKQTELGQIRAEKVHFISVHFIQTQIQQDRANKPPKAKQNNQPGVMHAVASAPTAATTGSGPMAQISDVNVATSAPSNRRASMGAVDGTGATTQHQARKLGPQSLRLLQTRHLQALEHSMPVT